VVAGVRGAGIIRTTNGTNFSDFTSGIDGSDVRALVYANASTLYAGVYAAIGSNGQPINGGIFRSVSGGAWTDFFSGALPAFMQRRVTALETDSSGNLIVGMANNDANIGALLRNSGSGWTSFTFPGFNSQNPTTAIRTIHRDRRDGNRWWIGRNYFGPVVTVNNGASFDEAANNGNANDRDVYGRANAYLTTAGFNGVIRATAGLGLWQSNGSSANETWTQLTGFRFDRVRSFAISQSNSAVSYMGVLGGGVHRSTNSGVSFTRSLQGFENKVGNNEFVRIVSPFYVAVSPSNQNDVYAATEAGLFRSTDGANNWQVVQSGNSPNNNQLGITQRPEGMLFVDGSTILYSSFNQPNDAVFRGSGNSYSRVLDVNSYAAGVFGAGKLIRGNSGRVYHLTNDNAPSFSNNGGVSFQRSNVIDAGRVVFSRIFGTAVAENATNASIVVMATNHGIYRSVDGGANFSRVAATGLAQGALTSMVYSGSTMVASDAQGTLWRSCNNGSSFDKQYEGVARIVNIVLQGTQVFLVTDGNGVVRPTVAGC
jgi:hypothetical protein